MTTWEYECRKQGDRSMFSTANLSFTARRIILVIEIDDNEANGGLTEPIPMESNGATKSILKHHHILLRQPIGGIIQVKPPTHTPFLLSSLLLP